MVAILIASDLGYDPGSIVKSLSNSIESTACDLESIHAPGSIQPHGMMLIVTFEDLMVRHVAGEVERRLGVVDWKDNHLDRLIGASLSHKVNALGKTGSGGFIGQLHTDIGETIEVSTHRSGRYAIVELEPTAVEHHPASVVLDGLAIAVAGFGRSAAVTDLCDKAAIEFRRLTGFDRVMVYRFLDDGAGQVLAEDRRGDLHSFLNLHFPASDIPQQARALYLRNLIRVIPDVHYQPAALRPSWSDPNPLDMNDSSLRSVSPVHLQYLNNMDVRASASISIVREGALWGLIACHHDVPRSLPYDVRAACRSLAASLAQQIEAKEDQERYRQHIRLRGFEDDIVRVLSQDGALDNDLSDHLDVLRRMMNGDGIAILQAGDIAMSGNCPEQSEVRALAAWLRRRPDDAVFSTDHLGLLNSQGSSFQQICSGLLAITLSSEEPWLLLWFRAERPQTIEWAGNPHKAASLDPHRPLTPRASFEAWRETVRGHALSWSALELAAATRLRASMLEAQQNRRVRDLNRKLTKVMQHKDLLLKQQEFLISEINHRVQNSLQLVSSFLSIQARASGNAETQRALEEARRRLTAVAAVHRRLYRDDKLGTVDAARYIEELCADTFSFMGRDWAEYLSLNLSPVVISTDRAVTLGLLLTELMINSNKYAYDGAAGPITIELTENRGRLRLVVADKGIGKISTDKGFGSRIMEGLVLQLGGKLIYGDNSPGLRATLTAPIQQRNQVTLPDTEPDHQGAAA